MKEYDKVEECYKKMLEYKGKDFSDDCIQIHKSLMDFYVS